jgi:hypothetical protein
MEVLFEQPRWGWGILPSLFSLNAFLVIEILDNNRIEYWGEPEQLYCPQNSGLRNDFQ